MVSESDGEAMAKARAFATGLRGAAAWFNKLERRLTTLAEHAAPAAALLEAKGHQDEADALRHTLRDMERELYGDDGGADHPEAEQISSEPMVAPNLFDAAYALTQSCEAIAEAGGQLKIDGPVSDEDVSAFSTSLYEVQAACRTLLDPDKSGDHAQHPGNLPGETDPPGSSEEQAGD